MKGRREKTRAPIRAAGGIVVRGGREPLIAIVQLRKCNSWVLPKGKLNGNESALAAARREVLEEVGYRVHIHEFLGTMSHDVGSRTKIVQFWRMRAIGEPAGRVARDVKAVRWLPLEEAIEKLTRLRERAFLDSIGPAVRAAVERSARQDRAAERRSAERFAQNIPGEIPVEPAVQPLDTPIVELIQPPGPNDFVATAPEDAPRDNISELVAAPEDAPRDNISELDAGPKDAPRDNIADKVRLWFRRISLLNAQAGRRA
jgi:8-oxo-dGTP diphosphatase